MSVLGEVPLFKALEVSMWCVRGDLPGTSGLPALRGRWDQVTELSPFKHIWQGWVSAQGVDVCLSRSNLAFAGSSGGVGRSEQGGVP